MNDVFKADAYYIKVGQLSIFNRWGAMIFDSNGRSSVGMALLMGKW
ncbi:MAG: hypothetical protein IPI15_16495 [Saprospiraceae bacterium]|nr:hypothetical protein [Candidatus Brachybacter algidus]